MNYYDFDKSGQDMDISSGKIKYQLPPAVRNNFIGIERIKRRPMPKVDIKNMDTLYAKKMKDLEDYYTLEVDYLTTEKRPTMAELGKKGKDLYDLYNRVAKNAKNKGDITRPQKKEPQKKEPKETDDMETIIMPEGMPLPNLDGDHFDDIPWGQPIPPKYDEGKHDDTLVEEDVKPPMPPKFDKDDLYDNDDEIKWIIERNKLINDQKADEDYMSDDWDDLEEAMKPKYDPVIDDDFDADNMLEELEVNVEGAGNVDLNDDLQGILNDLEGN